jgi:hypothetical protein
VLQPLSALLFGKVGEAFDTHHSFMVQYKAGEDLGLDMHTDDADVTFNVCLGKNFTGAGLTFCGTLSTAHRVLCVLTTSLSAGTIGTSGHRHFNHCYKHQKGVALMHLGNRRHGADDIESGERYVWCVYDVCMMYDVLVIFLLATSFGRYNLIVWNHNLAYRASRLYAQHERSYEQEGGPPDRKCLSYTHDRDYGAICGEETAEEKRRGPSHAWCPPHGLEHNASDNAMKQDSIFNALRS